MPPPNNSAGFTFALCTSFANASTSEFSDLLEALSKSKLTLSGEVIKMMECLAGQRIIAFGFSRSIRLLLLQPLHPERGRIGSHTLLAHHLNAGHIIRVRRGLYAAVPPRTEAENFVVDPYLVAIKAACNLRNYLSVFLWI